MPKMTRKARVPGSSQALVDLAAAAAQFHHGLTLSRIPAKRSSSGSSASTSDLAR